MPHPGYGTPSLTSLLKGIKVHTGSDLNSSLCKAFKSPHQQIYNPVIGSCTLFEERAKERIIHMLNMGWYERCDGQRPLSERSDVRMNTKEAAYRGLLQNFDEIWPNI